MCALGRESNDSLEQTKVHSEVIAGDSYVFLTGILVMQLKDRRFDKASHEPCRHEGETVECKDRDNVHARS